MTNLRRKLGAPSATGVTRTYPGVGYLLEDTPPQIARGHR